MRKLTILPAVLLAFTLTANAQTNDGFLKRYKNQVDIVGFNGPGVISILDEWEASAPEDGDMLRGKFSYYLASSISTKVVDKRDRLTFMGEKPLFELKDSLGRAVPYFMEQFFNDSLFNKALTYIGRAIELYPKEISYRAEKISAYISYEKEHPKNSIALLLTLADEFKKNPSGGWTNFGQSVTDNFELLMQDFCYSYYHIGSNDSYEAFYQLSAKMNKMYPKSELYLGDLGSYWLVAKGDTKKARKYYEKLLKINPESELGTKNMAVIDKVEAAKKKK